jgi:NAD(P)-dependent dehydrogenase (short-subunit alcohol dehydrogenase family)
MRLQGKIALVTGATSGIGQAIVEAFAREGARVVVSGRNSQRGKAVVETIQAAGGTATFVRADLSTKAEAERLAREASDVFGSIDILVNNAGTGAFDPIVQADESAFDTIVATNLKCPFYLTTALAPRMAERKSGKVINITSMAAHIGLSGFGLYGATKAALTLLTRSWAAEFGPSGVNVNAISPGPTRTPWAEAGLGEMLDQLAQQAPAMRVASPSEIADAAVYLASNEANFVHGVTLHVDGGRTAI